MARCSRLRSTNSRVILKCKISTSLKREISPPKLESESCSDSDCSWDFSSLTDSELECVPKKPK